ncbi:MAG: hypothetical protein ABSB79_05070 [Syntrophales bacterium]
MKAKYFWGKVAQGYLFNPLNIPPLERPPGTVLMSFPLGWSENFHGFYFRSVFFPIVCLVTSVYLATGLSQAKISKWAIISVAFLFSSLPLLYHFELVEYIPPGCGTWGLVDNFQAGIAALATATFIRSVKTISLRWLGAGAVLVSLTLFIKPSGALIMALTGTTWFIITALAYFRSRISTEAKHYAKYGVLGCLLLFTLFILTLTLCLLSGYLSKEHFVFQNHALSVIRNNLNPSMSQIIAMVHSTIGEPIVIYIFFFIALFFSKKSIRNLHYNSFTKLYDFMIAAFIVWGGGLYLLIKVVGIVQIRQIAPFFLMGLIYLIPIINEIYFQINRLAQITIFFICFLIAANTALLLAYENPPITWQKASGVSVSTSTNSEEVQLAYSFLNKVRIGNHNVKVYNFNGLDAGPVTFTSVGHYELYMRPNYPTFWSDYQYNLLDNYVTRVRNVLSSDYLLFQKIPDDKEIKNILHIKTADTFETEHRIFQAWLNGLSEADGVKSVIDGSRIKLLEITDRSLFAKSIYRLIDNHAWRSDFEAANF